MSIRLNKVIKEFNVGLQTVVDFLTTKGFEVKASPSEKISDAQYDLLRQEFGADRDLRTEAEKMIQNRQKEKIQKEKKAFRKDVATEIKTEIPTELRPKVKVMGTIDLNQKKADDKTAAQKQVKDEETKEVAPGNTNNSNNTSNTTEAPKTNDTESEMPKPQTNNTTEAANVAANEQNDGQAAAQQGKKQKQKLSVEERAAAIGEENNGVFKLHTQTEIAGPKVLGVIDLSSINQTTRPKKKSKEERRKEREEKNRQGRGGNNNATQGQNAGEKKKRTRIGKERVDVNAASNQQGNKGRQNQGNQQGGANNAQGGSKRSKERNRRAKEQQPKQEISDEDVAKQVKETLARLTNKQKGSRGAKYRKEKREQVRERQEEERLEAKAESKVLKLTEFVTANELATMMDVPVTKVIGTCMSIGIMVSINQRMDAETIDLVAEEFGFKTEYVSADVQDAIAEEEDNEEDLEPRAPIVTVMGHVDHGKTSLLDYIRKANVIAGEAGGITQHIGAYNVTLESGRHITFLDTPGHEAFTAMRARGAQVTDIAIIIIAADDDIMPQTKEAINHAVAANVPIVFAINKIDKPHANPDKIKEGLATMNFLVEEWGGKYQSQDISAKKGIGVKELLEKVLLEADMLELKANPNRKAVGTIIESSLDKGRGYVATVLVSNGTLHQGDVVLAGTNYGRVKALFNERNQRVKSVGPSQAATLLGFNGAPQAGDQFHVMETEQEAREIANKREQLQREQDLRTHKMLTLDEVGRRIKLGSFKEMNIIVKGDVDGSVEALSDSFIKLSTENIAVNVIHKGVGQISENDVTLAAASQAVIVGFQVRPSQAARKLAEHDGVDIRLYSVIYDAIEEVKEAMEGMLEPVIKEEVTATIEVRQVYHISKVGYVAGAYVIDGKVKRTDKARLIRDGIVIFTGEINALKRFKDDVKEVTTNFECGISLTNCNDIKEGDIIETFQEVAIKQKL
ncbi:MAG: translation initiation factor IF-2 [Prevotellamassilia sp.]|nr:translation initiation factor IF-2 [Prevotellamassilia sp.]